jgi:hypothetical protein
VWGNGGPPVRALQVVSDLGAAANGYTPDAAADLEASQLIAYGELQAMAAATANIQTENAPLPTTLTPQHAE